MPLRESLQLFRVLCAMLANIMTNPASPRWLDANCVPHTHAARRAALMRRTARVMLDTRASKESPESALHASEANINPQQVQVIVLNVVWASMANLWLKPLRSRVQRVPLRPVQRVVAAASMIVHGMKVTRRVPTSEHVPHALQAPTRMSLDQSHAHRVP